MASPLPCVAVPVAPCARCPAERLDALAGSPTYMAPELLNYPPKVTKAVDWWALGCMMFEVTTGRHPFMNEEDEVVLDLVTTADPQLDDTQGIAISDDLKDLVRRFLIKEPEERLQVCGDGVRPPRGSAAPCDRRGGCARDARCRGVPLIGTHRVR